MKTSQKAVTLGAAALIGVTLLGGCVYRKETVPAAASPPSTVVITPGERVVTYPEGRWELRGTGNGTNPYYWVWIPAGVNPPSPPPPPQILR